MTGPGTRMRRLARCSPVSRSVQARLSSSFRMAAATSGPVSQTITKRCRSPLRAGRHGCERCRCGQPGSRRTTMAATVRRCGVRPAVEPRPGRRTPDRRAVPRRVVAAPRAPRSRPQSTVGAWRRDEAGHSPRSDDQHASCGGAAAGVRLCPATPGCVQESARNDRDSRSQMAFVQVTALKSPPCKTVG